MRRDSATGLTQVGWESDLPLGRFVHLELICELTENILPDSSSEFYTAYQAAIQQARQANALMLEQQRQQNQAKGWYLVPFTLAQRQADLESDCFGNYTAAAMRLHFLLTRNIKPAWAVVRAGRIVHLRAREPAKELDELSYQVWYHQQRHQLEQIQGSLLEGELYICESGLWFDADSTIPG